MEHTLTVLSPGGASERLARTLEAALEAKMERWVYLNDLAERIAQQEAQRRT